MGSLIDRSLEQAAFAGLPGLARHRPSAPARAGARQARARRGGRRSRSATTSRRLRLRGRLPHRLRGRRLRRDLRGDRLHRPGRADLRAAADRRPSRPGDPAGRADRGAAAARRRPRRPARAARADLADRRGHRPARRALLPLAGRAYALAAGVDDARAPPACRCPGGSHDAALEIGAGELVCLVGPNGSGKTSLLHALAGIGRPVGRGQDRRRAIRAGSARRSGRAGSPICPRRATSPWPLSARDLIALGGGEATAVARARSSTPLLDRRVDTPVDRRAQPGADRPRAGAAAEAAAARRADRQSRPALADPADGADPRRAAPARAGRRWSRSTTSTRPRATPTG